MSAQRLREAALLMRVRADAATPGAWLNRRGPIEQVVTRDGSVVAEMDKRNDRRHVTSWQPSVASTVADLLEIVAAGWEDFDPDGPGETPMQIVSAWALNIANAYLEPWSE